MSGYKLILADPPWSYQQDTVNGGTVAHYCTMSIAELCEMDVSGICDTDAVLLLWATWPLLDSAFDVMRAWGFSYKTGFPWIKIIDCSQNLDGSWYFKPQYGCGFWVRGASEPLLIGTRGHVSPPKLGHVGLLSENMYHSRKPDSIYEYAESLPGPYLEMFARRRRDGWDAFGNEISGSVEINLRACPAARASEAGAGRRDSE